MEEPADTHFDVITPTVKKRRSLSFRRPRADSHVAFVGSHDHSLLMSSAPPDETSDDVPAFDTNPKRKEFSLSHCMSRAASVSESQRDNLHPRRIGLNNNRRSTEGALAPANWRNTSHDDETYDGRNNQSTDTSESTKEGKVKKVKLKVSGPTRGMNANGGTFDGLYKKVSGGGNDSSSRAKPNLEGNSDDCITPRDKKMGSVRKSKRVPKRRLLDGEFSEEDDNEIRYLEKLKSKSFILNKEEDEETSVKQSTSSRISNAETIGKRKSRLDKVSKDGDYEENDDELVESHAVNNREVTLTSRQRALQSTAGSSIVEFPNGLPPAPSRKKQKLSDVEQQLKKEEAAKRRRLQNEKNARESEAEAIRKILGQDSNRKKREDKLKKRQQDLAQEKAAHEQMAASSCIRIIMRPNETTVTFPENMGLPSLFNSKPASYPPPREK